MASCSELCGGRMVRIVERQTVCNIPADTSTVAYLRIIHALLQILVADSWEQSISARSVPLFQL